MISVKMALPLGGHPPSRWASWPSHLGGGSGHHRAEGQAASAMPSHCLECVCSAESRASSAPEPGPFFGRLLQLCPFLLIAGVPPFDTKPPGTVGLLPLYTDLSSSSCGAVPWSGTLDRAMEPHQFLAEGASAAAWVEKGGKGILPSTSPLPATSTGTPPPPPSFRPATLSTELG